MIFDKKEKYLNGDGLFEVSKLEFVGGCAGGHFWKSAPQTPLKTFWEKF
jgi:hypothetical protein